MGLYLTPPRMTKERFLERFGRLMSRSAFRGWNFGGAHALPVALLIGDDFSIARVFLSTREIVDYLRFVPEAADLEFYGVQWKDMRDHRVMAPEALAQAENAM